MPNIRAMVIFQGASNLPEDRFVNTWHFVRLDSLSSAADVLTPHFDAFYSAINPWLSSYVAETVEVRYYDLADLEPRVPEIRTFSKGAAAVAGQHVPLEATVVLSFHGEPPITGRRRGRVYIGPLNDDAVSAGDGTNPPRVGSGITTALATAAGAFLDEQNGWRIRSSVPSENFVPVVGGWVDNELDTQRRRGVVSTSRLTFS